MSEGIVNNAQAVSTSSASPVQGQMKSVMQGISSKFSSFTSGSSGKNLMILVIINN